MYLPDICPTGYNEAKKMKNMLSGRSFSWEFETRSEKRSGVWIQRPSTPGFSMRFRMG